VGGGWLGGGLVAATLALLVSTMCSSFASAKQHQELADNVLAELWALEGGMRFAQCLPKARQDQE
jgi:hypothetical protein